MNVTPEVIAKVSAYVKDKTAPLDQILADLNNPTIDNPEPRNNIQSPLSFAALVAVIKPESLGKVITYIHFDEVIADLRANNYDAAALWVAGLTAAGILSPEDAQAIGASLAASIPDPAWNPKLSWAEVNLGENMQPIDIADCAKYGKWSS